MDKKIQIIVKFTISENKSIDNFKTDAEHILSNLMDDYGDDNGQVTILEIE